MRLVLDTNIVLSALLWRGSPYALLSEVRNRTDVRLFSSLKLLDELAGVLARPSLVKRLATIGVVARDVVADYLDIIDLVEPVDVPRVVASDPDDDHVIAAAVAAQADMIVSGDKRHMLALGSHQGIAILSAVHALERIARETDPQ